MAVDYLQRILTARVYDVAVETPLVHAQNLSARLGNRVMLKREDSRRLHSLLHQMLSEFEWKVLSGYQMGKSYREIARELRFKTKSVDNALMRIKRKVSLVSVEEFDWVLAD